jgi:hypothetical protein
VRECVRACVRARRGARECANPLSLCVCVRAHASRVRTCEFVHPLSRCREAAEVAPAAQGPIDSDGLAGPAQRVSATVIPMSRAAGLGPGTETHRLVGFSSAPRRRRPAGRARCPRVLDHRGGLPAMIGHDPSRAVTFVDLIPIDEPASSPSTSRPPGRGQGGRWMARDGGAGRSGRAGAWRSSGRGRGRRVAADGPDGQTVMET